MNSVSGTGEMAWRLGPLVASAEDPIQLSELSSSSSQPPVTADPWDLVPLLCLL